MPHSLLRSLATALFLLSLGVPVRAQETFRPVASVILLNDVYRIDAVENGTVGGLGRVATLARRTRRESSTPSLILLHSKDRALMSIPPGPDVKLLAFDALTSALARGESIAPQVEGRIIERDGNE